MPPPPAPSVPLPPPAKFEEDFEGGLSAHGWTTKSAVLESGSLCHGGTGSCLKTTSCHSGWDALTSSTFSCSISEPCTISFWYTGRAYQGLQLSDDTECWTAAPADAAGLSPSALITNTVPSSAWAQAVYQWPTSGKTCSSGGVARFKFEAHDGECASTYLDDIIVIGSPPAPPTLPPPKMPSPGMPPPSTPPLSPEVQLAPSIFDADSSWGSQTPAKAFDGNVVSKWHKSGSPGWILAGFSNPVHVNRIVFAMSESGHSSRYPGTITISASDDRAAWTTLLDSAHVTYMASDDPGVSFASEVALPSSSGCYSFFRFNVINSYGRSGTSGDNKLSIHELSLFGHSSTC